MPLNDAVRMEAARRFASEWRHAAEALDRLALPLLDAPNRVVDRARVQLAILKLAAGDMPALQQWGRRAETDWRDVLVAAGMANANWRDVLADAGFATPVDREALADHPLDVRLAEPTDADLIADVHAESWRRTYRGDYRDEFLDGDVFADRRAVWKARLSDPAANQFVAVAVGGARIVGFVCAFGANDPKWGSLIDNLHVVDAAKRRGVGASLMRRAGAWLSERYPSVGVYLEVLESNRAAQAFYERLGGENVGTIECENPGGGTSRHHLYAWTGPRELVDRTSMTT